MKSFDSCEYNRCNIAPHDFSELQYWLFQLHNDVTIRVFETKSSGYQNVELPKGNIGSNDTSALRVKAFKYGIYYPPQDVCPSCILPQATSSTHSDVDSSISRKEKQSKKNPSLRFSHQTESETKPEVAEFSRKHTTNYLISSYWKASWSLHTGK